MRFYVRRRDFGRLTLTGLAAPFLGGLADSTFGGVPLGVQTYSFRDLPRPQDANAIDVLIKAMTDCGLSDCGVVGPTGRTARTECRARYPGHTEVERVRLKAREDLRAWRSNTSLDYFRGIKQKFDAAGITIYAYNYSFSADMTDAEIDRGFEMARALGAEIITASTNLTVAKRVAPFADKHRMIVAMHGHSNRTDPNEFCTPESFAVAMKMSK